MFQLFYTVFHVLCCKYWASVTHSEKCRVNVSDSSGRKCPQRSVGIGIGDTGVSDLFLEVSLEVYFWRSENPPTLFTNHITDTMAHADSVGKVLHLPLCVCAFVCVCIVLWRSTTMLRVFPALWWCNAHCARAPCLQGHMSFLKLWTTPTATATVYYVYWLLSLRHYCQFKDNK